MPPLVCHVCIYPAYFPLITLIVTINNEAKQTIKSFGASGAWWPNDLIHFPEKQQKHLGELLFSEHGLYLSSYRYNMGGDGGNDTKQVTTPGSRVESFMKTDGIYDFSRDHAGVTFLKMARHHSVPYITFFINAAPSHIADNGQACGWNLTEAKIPAFADYIQRVLSYWTTDGVKIKYISPMNEPDNLRADCGQEGMTVNKRLRTSVFQAIKSALVGTASSVVDIIGDETSRITTQAAREDASWLPSSAPYLSNIAVHNYDYPSDASLAAYYNRTLALTNNSAPAIKFTETCCSTTSGSGPGVFGQQYDPTMVNALIVARYIWQYLTIVNAESFDWWTAVTTLPCSPKNNTSCATAVNNSAGYNSGLFYIDGDYNTTKDFTIYPTKRAYALKHFSYFIRPGSVRYDLSAQQLPAGVEALATLGPAAANSKPLWNVLFLNNQTSAQDVTVRLPGKNGHVSNAVKTDPAYDWAEVRPLPGVSKDGGSVDVRLPAQSMVSMQFSVDL